MHARVHAQPDTMSQTCTHTYTCTHTHVYDLNGESVP